MMKNKTKLYIIACLLISFDFLFLSVEIFFGYLHYLSSENDSLFHFWNYLPLECIVIFVLVFLIAIMIPYILIEKEGQNESEKIKKA